MRRVQDLAAPTTAPAETSEWDLIPDGIVLADANGTVTRTNAVARKMLGLDDLDPDAGPDAGPDRGHGAAPGGVGRPLREVLALQGNDGESWWGCNDPYDGFDNRIGLTEQSWVLPDGEEVLVTGRLTRARGGPVESVGIVLRSGRGRARLDRERSDLVATVAHELRSPLTGVRGFVTSLLSKWEVLTDEQRKLMLETVDHDAQRLGRLITELLDVARIDTGRLPLHRRDVDLGLSLDRVLASVGAGTNRPLSCSVAEDLPTVHADPDKLAQVLTNLVENAVRHGEGQVTVRAEPADGLAGSAVRVVVDDEGEGIPEEMRRRVFTKFWKGGARGGTGLGMYIVNGLVAVHGGTLEIGSSPAGGARITLLWPSAESGSPAGPAPS